MKHAKRSIPVTDLLASLAETIRLRILRILETEELSVGEVARVVQLPQSTVSRHLKVLADAGWLARRAAGTATLYRLLLDDLSLDARALWIAVRSQMSQSAELAEDSRRLVAVVRERRLDSQAFFGQVAGEWDDLRTELFGREFTSQALLSLLPRNWIVADLGCGTGNASELLAHQVERVIAIDQSEPMLEAARKRLQGMRNVQFSPGQLEKLPLKDASVDATVCMLVIHHVPDSAGALKEMRRVLRTERGGGIALIVDMVEHDREEYRRTMGHVHLGFSARAVEDLMRKAGFEQVRLSVLPGAAEARGPGLFAVTGRVP